MPPEKSSLSIRLTEPVVTLRTTPDRTSRQHEDGILPPAVVRGLLTLDLAKPTKVSSIELKLKARAITHYVQGSGPTRIDVTEQYKVYSASTVVFKVDPVRQVRQRATSTKPRVQFLGHHTEYGAHDHSPSGFGNKRSISLDPYSASSRITQPSASGDLEIAIDRDPRQDKISLDSAPPYPGPANGPSFLKPDSPVGRSPSVASSSRISESQNILSQTNSTPDIHYDSSSSSIRSVRGVGISISRTSSIEEIPEDDSDTSATGPLDVAYYGLSRIATGSSSHSSDQGHHRGRSHSRFSFGKVVHVFEAVKDRVRSRSPRAESRRQSNEREERGRSLIKGKGKAQADTRSTRHFLPHIKGAEPSLADGVDGDGWVLFPEGTHTYPIFFTIPHDSPPTAKVDRGSLTWKVKAEVKRPSAFKSNMTTEKEVVVVSVPRSDDTEQVGGLDLEREWDGQFHYRIQVVGRGIPIGGKMPFQLTITPLTKFRLHSIMIHLDERTEYYTQAGSRVQSDAIRRATLLVVRHNNQNQRYSEPILPLASDELDLFRKSPLYRFLRPGEDESEVASSFAGLGPWTIRHELALPDSCSILRPSNRSKRSNVMVDHTLKIILRVEKEDGAVKKKLYDVMIQAPIQILSCHCTSEWTSLPSYDEVPRSEEESSEDASTCPCRTRRQANVRRDSHGADNHPVSREGLSSLLRVRSDPSDSPTSRTQLHERLMRGLVSERGEPPPSYERMDPSVHE